MLYLKACPRCRGDVYLDRDSWGAYMQCLQCGRMREIPDRWLAPARDPHPKTATVAAGPRAA